MRQFVLAFALAATSCLASGQTFNAAAGFSDAANPSGLWSYGFAPQ